MLLDIASENYNVKAICKIREDLSYSVPVIDFLKENRKTMRSHVDGMMQLFKRYAAGGRAKLTNDVFHQASDDGIWRFSKGQLRVYGFLDGNTIVLTNCALKKSQKTDKSDADAARREKEKYMEGRQK